MDDLGVPLFAYGANPFQTGYELIIFSFTIPKKGSWILRIQGPVAETAQGIFFVGEPLGDLWRSESL